MPNKPASNQDLELKPGKTAGPGAGPSLNDMAAAMPDMLGQTASPPPSQPPSQPTETLPPNEGMPPEEMIASFAAALGDKVSWQKMELQDGTLGVGLFFPSQFWTLTPEGRLVPKE